MGDYNDDVTTKVGAEVAQSLSHPELKNIINLVRQEVLSQGLSRWTIMLVAAVSIATSIVTFVIYDNLAQPRILRYQGGASIIDALKNIQETEQKFLKRQNDMLHQEVELLERLHRLEEQIERLEGKYGGAESE